MRTEPDEEGLEMHTHGSSASTGESTMQVQSGKAGDQAGASQVEPTANQPPTNLPTELTDRQVEVLRLVARGLTNKQVANELGLSAYTVETHLRHIYAKLKVSTRGAAIRFAMEHNLG